MENRQNYSQNCLYNTNQFLSVYSLVKVAAWESSNIGCFFFIFIEIINCPDRVISKKQSKKWRKCKVKEYSKGIYVKFKPEEAEILHDRMKEAGVQNMSAYIRKMALNG